jgi:C-terminal processing protease CtpA/Prc
MNITVPLAQFRQYNSGLTLPEMQLAVGQALILIDELYAHLPLKQGMYGIDPVQRLKLLTVRLPKLGSEADFHCEMMGIFNSLRDLHTNYLLPEPYRGSTAFLPFMVEEYFDEHGAPHYPVTHVMPGLGVETFRTGVEITHWNGMRMSSAVDQNAEENAGSNRAGRHIQGLRNMTVRPLVGSLPPDEDWVIVTYFADGNVYEAKFQWMVFRNVPKPDQVNAYQRQAVGSATMGLDLLQQVTHQARKYLFVPDLVRRTRAMRATVPGNAQLLAAEPGNTLTDNPTAFPDELLWGKLDTSPNTFGYLRIRSFNVEDVPAFVNEVIRILALVPQNGLILDVRSNPGGNILAGEHLLQLFTDRTIEPEPMFFRNTTYTMNFAQNPDLRQWAESIRLSVQTAFDYSQGFALETPQDVNAIGRKYPGPTVLLTDAACYSTTDIFAAGFQDHEIGPVLGCDESTGAGGANVWTHALLRQFWPATTGASPLQPLPRDMDMRVAFRRSTRVGKRVGLPLEDLGVESDVVHRTTRRDVFDESCDLFDHAGSLLADQIRRNS